MKFPRFIRHGENFIKQIITQKNITAKDNKIVYESKDVVDFYAKQHDLQEPESAVLNKLGSKLAAMSMLDIGVGAGRTTLHFALLAKKYLGIDYSTEMINACLKKYQNSPKISFLVSDARTLKRFKNSSFDFVLFSFNGIDYMNHEERIETLREIRRIIRHGGFFCFSTHNLNFLFNKCQIKLSKHPVIFVSCIFNLLQIRFLNKTNAWKTIRSSYRSQQFTMVNDDGTHNFRLRTYYITPIEQLKQLRRCGYSDTKIYSLTDGHEFKNLSADIDNWAYFLTKVP